MSGCADMLSFFLSVPPAEQRADQLLIQVPHCLRLRRLPSLSTAGLTRPCTLFPPKVRTDAGRRRLVFRLSAFSVDSGG